MDDSGKLIEAGLRLLEYHRRRKYNASQSPASKLLRQKNLLTNMNKQYIAQLEFRLILKT